MYNSVRKTLFNVGSLFTWGQTGASLGYPESQIKKKPVLVKGFENNVVQAELGQNHSALITTEGKLYTWGAGGYGQLGHNNDVSITEPQEVQFFTKNNLKVTQIALGDFHTVALTNNGDVWTFGYGGKEQNFLMNLLFLQIGSLGHGDMKHRYTPTPIKEFRKQKKIKEIQSGLRYTNAINEDGELYVWGKGEYGVFGNGNNKSYYSPVKNLYFEDYLKKQLNQTIVKLKSCNNFSVALMSDGNLYGWGSNEFGQMGIKNEIGVEIYETANFPTPIVKDAFNGSKIIDFVVGEDIIAVLLDNNEVYWCGCKAEYSPVKFQLPQGIGKITHIGCCYRCVVVVTEDGQLFYRKKFFELGQEDLATGIFSSTIQEQFETDKAKIDQIGGSYRNRYAIVQL